jgi:hypothetical protein
MRVATIDDPERGDQNSQQLDGRRARAVGEKCAEQNEDRHRALEDAEIDGARVVCREIVKRIEAGESEHRRASDRSVPSPV